MLYNNVLSVDNQNRESYIIQVKECIASIKNKEFIFVAFCFFAVKK